MLIGRDGAILHHAFGVEDDIAVGARIAMALSATPVQSDAAEDGTCADGRCAIPTQSVAMP